MELLLLLTALLASLTGVGSADRAVRQAPGVALVHAVEAVQAAEPAQRAAPATVLAAAADARGEIGPRPDARPLASQHFPFERRLE